MTAPVVHNDQTFYRDVRNTREFTGYGLDFTEETRVVGEATVDGRDIPVYLGEDGKWRHWLSERTTPGERSQYGVQRIQLWHY